MSLQAEAFSGVLWTAIERFGQQAVQFVVLVVLARLLTPEDFGLVAMLMVIFAVSSVLVNGGFSEALIREPELTDEDKTTAFWLNLIAAVVLYGLIWVGAPAVAAFFEQPTLVPLTRVMGLNLIFFALTLVQTAELSHRLAFKRLGLINLAASVVTGGVAVALAFAGAGVWALAAKYVLSAAVGSAFLWAANPWVPRHGLSRQSVRKLFGFGSKLAASGLLNQVFDNIYKVVIGKFFSAATLGFYTQAQSFQNMASKSLVGVIQKVSYPLLSRANDDDDRLKRGYKRVITLSTYVTFPALVGMILVAEPLVIGLVGEKWRQTIPFLQILCVSGALYHLHSINLNILKVKGRSDLFLKLAILKKVNLSVAIVIGLQFGIWGLLVGQVVASYVALFINMYYTDDMIGYPISEQLLDVVSVMVQSVPMAVAVFACVWFVRAPPIVELLVAVPVGVACYVATGVATRHESTATVVSFVRSRAKGPGPASIHHPAP